MGKITDISVQRGNKNRVSVFIDGAFCCGLDALTAMKHRLKIGDEIEESELENIQADSEYASALDKSLSYLSVRPRSEHEIDAYLQGKGYLPAAINRVKTRIRELGYLDDAAYCRQYVSENKRRYGRHRLKAELMKRGVERDVVDEVLDEEVFYEETYALAKTLLRGCGNDKYKLKNKLYQKGCGADEISEAVERLAEEDAFKAEETDKD